MTVLLTGAAGQVGSALRELLPGHGWDVRSFDRDVIEDCPGSIVGDITSPEDLDRAMVGVSAVVHLAGYRTEAPWPIIRQANIEGTVQVFEAARRAGVTHLVYASSNHAAGFEPVRPGLPAAIRPRPDTLYGVSKAFGEALGSYYADRYAMRVACLRIGTFAYDPPHRRSLATWLSAPDCARLVDACLRSSTLRFSVLWGASDNTRRQWGTDGADVVGYRPLDDAEMFAPRFDGQEPDPWDGLVGGHFTTEKFGIDEIAHQWAREGRST